MAIDAWGDYTEDPNPKPYNADDGGGSYSGGTGVHIDPRTGKIDPNYHPPASGPGGGNSGVGPSLGSGGGTTPVNAGGILGSSLKWGDIINAALAIYGLHEAHKPPKIYPVPPSPSEQYRLDKTKSLYDFASNYTEQYLKGLGNVNPDFQMPNSLTGNPAFMGGVKAPTFDASKAPSLSGAPPAGTNPAASIPPGITPERVRVDPTTGKWTIDGATPQEQAWLDAANQVRNGNAPGGGSDTFAP